MMILDTDRLFLRSWNDSDAESLYKYASDERVGPIAGWLPHKDIAYSRAVIRAVLSRAERYAICLKNNGNELVGSIGLSVHDKEAELSYWVGVPFWGQGIAPEAVNEILRHGFEDLCLDIIYCGYFDGNIRSKRVQEKCGFEYHHTDENVEIIMLGETRVEHISAITRGQWQNTKKSQKNENCLLQKT